MKYHVPTQILVIVLSNLIRFFTKKSCYHQGFFRRETASGFYPLGKVEGFAFGGATVHFASLETSFHAANHTIPPPPSNEGCPLCPKDKNRSPLHGEKTLVIK